MSGNPEDSGIGQRRQIMLLLACVAAPLALSFTVYHLIIGHPERALASLSALVVAGLIAGILRSTWSHRPAVVLAALYTAAVTLVLLASGLFPAADCLWCFILPPLIAYAGGLGLARWLLPVYFVTVTVVVLWPGFVYYPLWQELELHVRFLGLLALISAVSYLYEHTRSKAQARLQDEVTERRLAEIQLALTNKRLSDAADEATRFARQAEAASEAKTRFLSQMSHDIRAPLTGIIGMASLLEITDLSAKQRGYLRTIRVSGDALTELVGGVLDLARIEAGCVDLRPSLLPVRSLIDEVRVVVEPLALGKGLGLVVDVSSELPEQVLGDAARLRQILLNLAGNAVKFTDTGRVVIRVGPSPDDVRHRWRIEVSDTGIGIPADQHRRIFESFTRVDSDVMHRRAGSGLGLAICVQLVDLMGGVIGLASEEGKGSTFWVDLPLVPSESERNALLGRSLTLPTPKALDLLVVDDSEIVRRVVSGLLRQAGHTVEEAPDARAAFKRMALGRFDAMFMDVRMPGMDGIVAVQRMRRGETNVLQPDIPVIAITGLSDPETRQRCLDAGMVEALIKPVDIDTLLAALALAGLGAVSCH